VRYRYSTLTYCPNICDNIIVLLLLLLSSSSTTSSLTPGYKPTSDCYLTLCTTNYSTSYQTIIKVPAREIQPCFLCPDKSLSDRNYVIQIQMTSHAQIWQLFLILLKKNLRCENSVGKRRLGDLYFRNECNVKTVPATTGLCDLVPAHGMKAYLGVAEVVLLILNLGTRRRPVATFTPRSLTPGKEPRYRLNRRVGEPQSQNERV
jgi:hypothetical protein